MNIGTYLTSEPSNMKHQYMNITDVGTYELNLGRKSDDLGLIDEHVNSQKNLKKNSVRWFSTEWKSEVLTIHISSNKCPGII